MRPVLYLDIDDTLLSWASGGPEPVPSTECFLRWAMDRFEVRWLTKWCPTGTMSEDLLADLSKMVGVDTTGLSRVQGCAWEEKGIKADGIAWLEHTVLGRDFAWVENREGVSDDDLEILCRAGFGDRYFPCNVSEDETALERTRALLERRFDEPKQEGQGVREPRTGGKNEE